MYDFQLIIYHLWKGYFLPDVSYCTLRTQMALLDLCHLQIELHRNVYLPYRLKLPSIRLLNSRVIRKLCTHISLFRDISQMPHHAYVTWMSWRLKSAASILFVQQIVKANRQKAPPYWIFIMVNAQVIDWPVDSLHKGSTIRRAFSCHDVIMCFGL